MKASTQIQVASATLLFFVGAPVANALTFSLDGPSPTVSGGAGVALFNEDDLINPGLTYALPGVSPPTGSGVGLEVDAVSYGRLGGLPVAPPVVSAIFAVTPGSAGAPGTGVEGEASAFTGLPGLSDELADVFKSTFSGFNTQLWDGDGFIAFAGTPTDPFGGSLGLLEPMGDNIDAIDGRSAPDPAVFGGSVFWSVSPGTLVGPYTGFSAADIFAGPATPGYAGGGGGSLYASALSLGLSPGDDIDALVYFEDGTFGATPTDIILFSLTSTSLSLAGGGALAGGSGADIFITAPGATPSLLVPAVALGLLASDEISGLDVIPEPGTGALLLLGLAGIMRRRRI